MNHIIICTTSYPSQSTGDGKESAGSFVAEFARNLSKENLVTVIAPGESSSTEKEGCLTVRRFAVASLPLSLLNIKNPAHWWKIFSTISRGQKELELIVNANRPSHILALWALPSGYWAKRVSQRYNIPYSVWALGSDIWSLGKLPVIKSVLRRTLIQANNIFADGHELCQQVERISNRTCTFLPSSRTLEKQPFKDLATAPPYKLAFLGRWHKNKGIDIFLDSLLELGDQDWQRISEVRIFGGGPMNDTVISKGSRLNSNGRPVEIGGFLNLQEASALYQWADYIMIPSRIESIPVVFSDAMQASCPIVTMPVGDLARIVNEFNVGHVASEVTVNAFKQALCEALTATPAAYKSNLNSTSQKFSSEGAVKLFLKHL